MNYYQTPPPPIPKRPSLDDNIEITNVKEGETVYQRFLLINGRAGPRNSKFDKPVYVLCNDFPKTTWPCVDSYFKAMVHLVPGPNTITFVFPNGHNTDQLHFHVNYLPLLQNPPLSLVIMIGSDSPALFDVPPEKQGQNTLEIAIKKLRMAGYMWQVFCAEQMYRNGMGRRTFQLDEAWLPDTVSSQEEGRMRHTARVHIIRSRHTVAEIRDIRRAQQSKYSNEEFDSLFDYFMEELERHPPFDKPCTVAGLILDSHWDTTEQVSLGHTALGGGAGDTALGVFGSHLLHAWPTSIEDIVPSLLNNTMTDTRYVANDANESGNWWRACNIGMGAMLHEVGHSYTLTHTPTGIMSRGYNNWNRTFVAKEPGLAPIPPEAEGGSHWHRADIIRLRFHPAFRIPEDGPIGKPNSSSPSFVALDDGQFEIIAPAGLSMLEIFVNGQYRTHLEFLQRTQPTALKLSIQDICARSHCRPDEKIELEVTCVNQKQKHLDNLIEFLNTHCIRLPGIGEDTNILKSDVYGLGEGGDASNVIFINKPPLRKIIVHHGSFFDGFKLIWQDGSQSVIGKSGGGNSEFEVFPGERIQGLVVRSGAWIDGLQFKMSSGRLSPWFGGQGGDIHIVEAPSGYELVGFFGTAKSWMEQIGIYYRRSL
ncbi:putative peptidase family-domain-containing protein [Cokeromyces recurvatus]|uniref:putative peptidase family-domain-containing protein n=1 Tax=Cokeromyces recurvatus TaxID=90255 RepID=UPI00221FBD1B|nr:putative peptidase family-domain-containing protein [Cokeromyces recurvatus]KAI7907358.1 putative peptidase family-domain-containing protein [Cokeromyces recurvatus]